MNCSVCSLAGDTRATVGVCTHCGAALCAEHFGEAKAHTVGGMRFGCPHALEQKANRAVNGSTATKSSATSHQQETSGDKTDVSDKMT